MYLFVCIKEYFTGNFSLVFGPLSLITIPYGVDVGSSVFREGSLDSKYSDTYFIKIRREVKDYSGRMVDEEDWNRYIYILSLCTCVKGY